MQCLQQFSVKAETRRTSFNHNLRAVHTSHREQHSLPLGKEWGRYLGIIACPHFTELCSDGAVKLRTFFFYINIYLIKASWKPKSHLLWVMGH